MFCSFVSLVLFFVIVVLQSDFLSHGLTTTLPKMAVTNMSSLFQWSHRRHSKSHCIQLCKSNHSKIFPNFIQPTASDRNLGEGLFLDQMEQHVRHITEKHARTILCNPGF